MSSKIRNFVGFKVTQKSNNTFSISISQSSLLLTGVSRLKGPLAGNGSERLANGLGSIVMGTSHEVLRYMGFHQKSLGGMLGPNKIFLEICPMKISISNFSLETLIFM